MLLAVLGCAALSSLPINPPCTYAALAPADPCSAIQTLYGPTATTHPPCSDDHGHELFRIDNCTTNCGCVSHTPPPVHQVPVVDCSSLPSLYDVPAANVRNFTHTCADDPQMAFSDAPFLVCECSNPDTFLTSDEQFVCPRAAPAVLNCPAPQLPPCPNLTTEACDLWRQYMNASAQGNMLDVILDPCEFFQDLIQCQDGVITEYLINGQLGDQSPVFSPDFVSKYFPNVSKLTLYNLSYPTPLASVTGLTIRNPQSAIPDTYHTLKRLTLQCDDPYPLKPDRSLPYPLPVYNGPISPNLTQLEYLSVDYAATDYTRCIMLHGAIPSTLSQLTHFEVPNSNLSGTIPSTLTQLQYLDVQNNQLTGTIPATLTQLKFINVTYNALSGHVHIPQSTCSLSLANRDHDLNRFSCPIPEYCEGECVNNLVGAAATPVRSSGGGGAAEVVPPTRPSAVKRARPPHETASAWFLLLLLAVPAIVRIT